MIAGIALALAAVGTGVAIRGQQQAAQGERRAEAIRQRQMQVTADRERRQAIRQAMQARAAGNVAGVNQGAFFGSGVAGGQAQAVAQGGRMVADTNVNENLGNLMFGANILASRGRMVAGIGSSLTGLGTSLMGNQAALQRIGAGWNTGSSLQFGGFGAQGGMIGTAGGAVRA